MKRYKIKKIIKFWNRKYLLITDKREWIILNKNEYRQYVNSIYNSTKKVL